MAIIIKQNCQYFHRIMLVVIALDYEGEGPVFDSWLGRKNFLMNSGLFTISLFSFFL